MRFKLVHVLPQENSRNRLEWSNTVFIFQLNFFERTVCVASVSRNHYCLYLFLFFSPHNRILNVGGLVIYPIVALLLTSSKTWNLWEYCKAKSTLSHELLLFPSHSYVYIIICDAMCRRVLRNNNLTGTIPSDIGEFSNLEQV